MNYNIVNIYIDFLKKSYLEFFKIILKNKYSKELCLAFIDRYISVRYYNETNYSSTKDIVSRVNKELIDVLEENRDEKNIELLKNIVALFAYILYFDDVCFVVEDMELISLIVNDDIIKLDDKKEIKGSLKLWYVDFRKNKETFNRTLETKDFSLLEKKLYRKIYYLELEHAVKISNLYSEYAIDKAYNTGIINEDKCFITYIMASSLILENAINLDFSRHYTVDLPSSIFEKEKKLARLFNIIDNTLVKKYISIKVLYEDYMKNKDLINKYINDGYFFVLELDSTYDGNYTELYLFPYILVKEDTEEYDIIIRDKDSLKSKIIRI